jgi:methylated-DNA-[protein]-cysteine S-methyltransferase
MRTCADSSIPCHRVIAAGGKLGGFGRDLHAKRDLLLAEGVMVHNGRVTGFANVRWKKNGRARAGQQDR